MDKNYTIIKDEARLDEFIAQLPDLEGEEKFYVALFARSKYKATEGLKADKQQLKRFLCTKDTLKDKLRKLEVREGGYRYNNISINQNSLCVYITPGPRCMVKSNLETMDMIVKNMKNGVSKNPTSIAYNAVQISYVKSKKIVDFDLDFKDKSKDYSKEIISFLLNFMNNDSFMLTRTHGGVHISVKPDKVGYKNWYNEIKKLEGIIESDVMYNGDGLLPLPGCVQSDFVPYVIKHFEYKY